MRLSISITKYFRADATTEAARESLTNPYKMSAIESLSCPRVCFGMVERTLSQGRDGMGQYGMVTPLPPRYVILTLLS